MNFGRFCESEFWMAKVAMTRMSKGNTFYGRKAHITSTLESEKRGNGRRECTLTEGRTMSPPKF